MTITGLSLQGHVVNDALRRRQVLSSCGYARAGVDVAVVNDDGVALPFGTIGEIVTRSPCVMAGYWKDSAATSAALRHGWLYTGDVGSIDADGLLTLHDRSKDLIISGGSNIYPREIEEVLLQHPHVRECAVIGRRDPDWGELPVAFIVTDGKEQISATALEALLAANLARFKRPRDWYFVPSLPKNNYGKVLKSALREQLARPDAGSGRPPA